MRAKIDVWSDYVCPFCYLEEPVLERLAHEFGHRLQINWRAFELRPEPVATLEPKGDYLREIWARAIYPMAEARGMILRLPPVQPRSRLAFQVAEVAREQGKFGAMNKALFQAFFEDGRDIGEPNVLVGMGAAVGLEIDSVQRALQEDQHLQKVLDDEELALQLGISGVPAMLLHHENSPIESAVFISGAQPYHTLRGAVDRLLGQAVTS